MWSANDNRLTTVLTIWVVAMFAMPADVQATSGSDKSRLNVVMILADDLAYRDLGFMGNEVVQTPHLDQLAGEAVVFPHGYVPMSVCRPSLATILTGLYPHQHGIHFNHPPPGLRAMRKLSPAEYRNSRATADFLIQQQLTLPQLLTEAGYACLQTGKHWEGSYLTAGFTHGMTLAKPAFPKDRFGTRLQNGGYVAHGNGDLGLAIGRETMQPIDDFLSEVASKMPFFIWYAPFLPHTPFDAATKYRKPYAELGIDETLVGYYAEITRFDDTVGELRTLLEKHGVTEHTLIVFASDNGYRPGGMPNAAGYAKADSRSKLSQYEDGLRTPIVFHCPQHIEPAVHQRLVQTVDLWPTIAGAVGMEERIPDKLPGMNLWPVCRGKMTPPARAAYGAIYPNDASAFEQPATDVRARWIRSGNHKLILPQTDETKIKPAFYDLASDADEQENLYADPQWRVSVVEMKTMLDAWWNPNEN